MKKDCTICVAKTKALISFAVTAKLICVFVFAYAKSRFSHNEAQLMANAWTLNIFNCQGGLIRKSVTRISESPKLSEMSLKGCTNLSQKQELRID